MSNKKSYVPSLPGYTTKLLDYTNISKNIIPAFYGPGQPPDVGEINNYSVPTKWPSNTLIRGPQVVWLELQLPLVYLGTFNTVTLFNIHLHYNLQNIKAWSVSGASSTIGSVYLDGSSYYLNGDTSPPSGGDLTWTAAPPSSGANWQASLPATGINATVLQYDSVITNPFPTENSRLKTVFNNVKTTLEKLRPNRTFLEVIDPWIAGIPTVGYKTNYFPNYSFEQDPQPYYPYITPNYSGSFFGCNNLFIYAGGPNTINFQFYNPIEPTTFLDDCKAYSLNILQKTLKYFFNYKLRIFSPDLPIATHPASIDTAWSMPAAPNVKISSSGGSSFYFYPPGDPPSSPDSGIEWAATSSTIIDSSVNSAATTYLSEINNINTINSTFQDNEKTEFLSNVSDLTLIKVDAKWIDYTNILTEDYLINLIAQEFNFSPTTGKDL